MMEFKNAQYNKFGTIDCEVNHPKFGWIAFTASPDDSEPHGKELYQAIIDKGGIAEYVVDLDALAKQVRAERDLKLLEVDAIVTNPLRWGNLTTAEQQVLSEYRKLLLDVPQQEGFPEQVKWPERPALLDNA